MEHFICVTCGTQFAASDTPPAVCPITCTDERQHVGPRTARSGAPWPACGPPTTR